jgi:hypothetical protein
MRPSLPARNAALRNGEKFYESGPCCSCGGTKRYARNARCAGCMLARKELRAEMRKEAFMMPKLDDWREKMAGVRYEEAGERT